MTKYTGGSVIDPFWVDIAGRGDYHFKPGFYQACCRASYTFRLGQWKKEWREAEARNDFEELDRLDKAYEMIGV